MNYPMPDSRLPVCFDFDDTLAEAIWPKPGIGAPIREGLDMLKWYQSKGYRIFIYTGRHWGDQNEIEKFLFYQLGATRSRKIQVICGKPLAGLYVDDRGYRFEREVT